jgi:hypothetical protein
MEEEALRIRIQGHSYPKRVAKVKDNDYSR